MLYILKIDNTELWCFIWSLSEQTAGQLKTITWFNIDQDLYVWTSAIYWILKKSENSKSKYVALGRLLPEFMLTYSHYHHIKDTPLNTCPNIILFIIPLQ